jgi:hypothetical protein
MYLRDLVAMSDLKLGVVAAEQHLEVEVTGAFTTDLLSPGRYLAGGELVLSSLMFRQGPDDSDAFVRQLVDSTVAGLAVGTANGPVPADILDACRRHNLPLLVVVPEVSFATIIERILFSRPRAAAPGTDRSAARRRRMISSVTAGAGLGPVLSEADADLGHAGTVLTTAGRVIAGAALSPAQIPLLVRGFLVADQLPAAVRGKPPFTVVPIGVPRGRIAGWFLAVPAAPADLSSRQWDAVTDLSEVIDLERSRLEVGARVERRLADRLLHLLDEGSTGTAEVEIALRSGGLPADSQLVAVAARRTRLPGRRGSATAEPSGTAAGVDGEVTRVLLEELLLTVVPVPVVARGPDEVIALAAVSADELPAFVAGLRTAAAGLTPGLSRERLALGISGLGTPPAGLRGLIEQARQARQVAQQTGSPVSVMTGEDVDSHVMLLANLSDGVHASYRQRLLGPLLSYDAEHHSELVRTLEAFLAHSGSWSAAARELHLHVNTLRYRVSRIEQLTGRDLGRLESQVDLFLALRMRP